MSAPDMLMSPGDRIKLYRERRSLSQVQAAQLKGCSVSYWRKWESGERAVTSIADWIEIARILNVKDLFSLTGLPVGHLPDDPAEDPHLSSVRAALLLAPSVEPFGPDRYISVIDHAWHTWQTTPDNHTRLGVWLPELIGMTKALQHLETSPANSRLVASAATSFWALVRSYARSVGANDLLLVAASNGVDIAALSNSPAAEAAAAFSAAAALSTRGWTEQSAALTKAGICTVQDRLDGPEELAMYGVLHLMQAVEFGRLDDAYHMLRALDTASDVAAKVGETNVWRTAFGPTSVAIYRAVIALEQGRAAEAVRIAAPLDLSVVPSLERRYTATLVMGQAHAQLRDDVAASVLLSRAATLAPERAKASPNFRTAVYELLRRETPTTRVELRPLAAKLGLN